MTPESVMTLGRTALEMTILVASPVLLVTLVVGLTVSIHGPAMDADGHDRLHATDIDRSSQPHRLTSRRHP